MRRALPVPLLLLAACSAFPPSGTEGPRQVVLGVGEEAALGEAFRLSFQAVSSDSRCPVDVQCVWAGEAALVVGRSHPTMRFRPDTLHLRGGRGVDSVVAGPFVVKAAALLPERRSGAEVPDGAYRATFAVRRR